jgi:hypothetical protein
VANPFSRSLHTYFDGEASIVTCRAGATEGA